MHEGWGVCSKCGVKYFSEKVKYPCNDIPHEAGCPACDNTLFWVSRGTEDYNIITEEQFNKNQRFENSTPLCTYCRRKMVLRNGSRGMFWGCPGHPNCTYTRDY